KDRRDSERALNAGASHVLLPGQPLSSVRSHLRNFLNVQQSRAKRRAPRANGRDFDDKSHSVKRNGGKLQLPPAAYRVLKLLASRQGKAASRHELYVASHGNRTGARSKPLDVHIKALEHRLLAGPYQIERVGDFGFRLMPAPSRKSKPGSRP